MLLYFVHSLSKLSPLQFLISSYRYVYLCHYQLNIIPCFSDSELRKELNDLDKVSCFPVFPDPEEELLYEDELDKIDRHTADILNITKQISELSSEE